MPESKWGGDFYCFHYLSCLNQLLHKSWDGLRAKAADCKPRLLWPVLYFCLIARLWTGMFLSCGSSGFQNKLCVFTYFILIGERNPASLQWGVLINAICRGRFWSTVDLICQRLVNYLRALWVKEKLQLKAPSFGTLKLSQDWHQVLENNKWWRFYIRMSPWVWLDGFLMSRSYISVIFSISPPQLLMCES